MLILALIAVGEYRRKAASVRDALSVEQTKRKISELRGRRDELRRGDVLSEQEIMKIDEELEANRKLIENVQNRANVSVIEMDSEFSRLGF